MKKALRISLLLTIAGAAAAAGYGWYLVQRPFSSYDGEVVVEIPQGFGSEAIIDLLAANGVLDGRYPALVYLYFSPYRGRLQAGEYRFDAPMNVGQVFEKLAEGSVLLHTFTVPEGLRVADIAERWERSGFGDAAGFTEAARAALPAIREIDPEAISPEGYLFPETYSFPKDVTAEEAVLAMIRGLREAVARLEDILPPEEWPLSLNDAVTLASLVESEAAVEDERTLISSVFHNRLERGMRLECDPTVIYALVQAGAYRGRLLLADLGFDSPYNTYLYPDLPPGPISNPGYASLVAAIQPARTDHIFFVRTDGGRHTFSATLAEHNRAVAAYRRSRN